MYTYGAIAAWHASIQLSVDDALPPFPPTDAALGSPVACDKSLNVRTLQSRTIFKEMCTNEYDRKKNTTG